MEYMPKHSAVASWLLQGHWFLALKTMGNHRECALDPTEPDYKLGHSIYQPSFQANAAKSLSFYGYCLASDSRVWGVGIMCSQPLLKIAVLLHLLKSCCSQGHKCQSRNALHCTTFPRLNCSISVLGSQFLTSKQCEMKSFLLTFGGQDVLQPSRKILMDFRLQNS